MVPIPGIGPGTSPLPRECSATEPNGLISKYLQSDVHYQPSTNCCETNPQIRRFMERETGIGPASLAWKARVLPLNYSRATLHIRIRPPGIASALPDNQANTPNYLATQDAPRGVYPVLTTVQTFKSLVDGAGFEPAYALASRFTVCLL